MEHIRTTKVVGRSELFATGRSLSRQRGEATGARPAGSGPGAGGAPACPGLGGEGGAVGAGGGCGGPRTSVSGTLASSAWGRGVDGLGCCGLSPLRSVAALSALHFGGGGRNWGCFSCFSQPFAAP